MDTYDKDVIRDIWQDEKIVEEIRAAALKKAQLAHPEIEFVIDHRTIDDYCYKQFDYPGVWYSRGFRLPDGFRNKEELIDSIAKDTVDYFTKTKDKKHKPSISDRLFELFRK